MKNIRLATIAILFLAVTVSYLLGVFATQLRLRRSVETIELTSSPTQHTTLSSISTISIEDPIRSLERLPRLSLERTLVQLSDWASSPLALAQQHALYDAIGRAQPADFPAIADSLLVKESTTATEAREVLYLRWLQEDPESILRYRYAVQDRWKRSSYYNSNSVITKLVEADLARTIEILRELEAQGAPLKYEYRDLYRIALSLPSSSLTEEAIAFSQDAAARLDLNLVESQRNLPSVTPAEVIASLSQDPAQSHSLFNQLAKTDLNAAIDLALAVDDPQIRNRFLEQALPRYASEHPHDAVWLVSELFDPHKRENAYRLAGALVKALEADPTAADSWLQGELAEDRSATRLVSLLTLGGTTDPALLPLLKQLPKSNLRTQQINQSLQVLAGSDFEAANKWISENLAPEEALAPRLTLITLAFDKDKAATLEFIESVPTSLDRQNAIRRLSQHWSSKNLEEALGWAHNLTDLEDQKIALRSLAHNWVASDTESAINFARESSDPALQLSFQQAIGNQLINYRSPEEALSYLKTLPVEANTNYLFDQAIANLAQSDPRKALDYLSQNTLPSAAQNTAVNALARTWASQDPEGAVLSLLGPGGEIAEKSLPSLVGVYLNFDPEGLIGIAGYAKTPELRRSFTNALKANANSRVDPDLYQALIDSLAP